MAKVDLVRYHDRPAKQFPLSHPPRDCRRRGRINGIYEGIVDSFSASFASAHS